MKEEKNVLVEKFADIKILRYEVPGFEQLSLQQKIYIYYLSIAACCGRDILWDQNNRYNLRIRAILEHIFVNYKGIRTSEEFTAFVVYLKRIWFSNGIHHHYSTEKIPAGFSSAYFDQLVGYTNWKTFEIEKDQDLQTTIQQVKDILFDDTRETKRVCLDQGKDLLHASSNNYYQNVSQAEAEEFYARKKEASGDNPVSHGLNSTLVKTDEQLEEKVWRSQSLYSEAICPTVFYLEKAKLYAENEQQKRYIEVLCDYYRSGDLQKFDEYNILWLQEQAGQIDFVNGFIEVYGDSLGIKGSWEALVNIKDHEASIRAEVLSRHAHWFEDHSPVAPRFKKTEVKGVSAKVIHAAMLGGDCYPATPIGINLPNSEWIREQYGSKSVTIENITYSYFLDSMKNGMLEEFAATEEEKQRAQQFGYLAGNLHTDLHECLGHGSGKINKGVKTEDLKNYYSTIEETRADLFALYYIMDEKMVELGLLPSLDAAKAEYDAYLRNALITQLTRIEAGKNIEESHMRNRQLIANWIMQHGADSKTVEWVSNDNKSFVIIRNYQRMRELVGKLLAEIQRIKSEGDFDAARNIVETYGVKIDPKLHQEVLERFKKLNIAPYTGFLNPEYKLIKNQEGEITDVTIEQAADFTSQMLSYSEKFGFLPLVNE